MCVVVVVAAVAAAAAAAAAVLVVVVVVVVVALGFTYQPAITALLVDSFHFSSKTHGL